jgi:hypothetical protein
MQTALINVELRTTRTNLLKGCWIIGIESREQNASGSWSGLVADKRTSCIGPLDSLERKRLCVKQSIDTLNSLKSHTHSDSHSHTLADIPSKRHPENTPSIPLLMLMQTMIHRQEDHHYCISTTVSQSLPVLNGLDWLDRMQNPNHPVHQVANAILDLNIHY